MAWFFDAGIPEPAKLKAECKIMLFKIWPKKAKTKAHMGPLKLIDLQSSCIAVIDVPDCKSNPYIVHKLTANQPQ